MSIASITHSPSSSTGAVHGAAHHHHGHRAAAAAPGSGTAAAPPSGALQGAGFTPGTTPVVPDAGSTASAGGLLSSDLMQALQAYPG